MVFTILIVDDEKEMCLSKIGTIETADEIVFGRAGDLQRLGARTLEGFPARVDPRERRLVAAGALPAAGG